MRLRPARLTAGAAVLVLAGSAFTACSSGSANTGSSTDEASASSSDAAGSTSDSGDSGDSGDEASAAPTLNTNIAKGASGVAVDKVLEVTSADGSLTDVKVSAKGVGRVEGELSADKSSWTATGGLEPGARYTVRAAAQGSDGTEATLTSGFRTQDLTLDQQTYPSVSPLQGETVGVGMPVIVNFDVPVTNRANFEKHMEVTTSPAQKGGWYWISDNEAHWRPKTYWKAGSKVSVDVDVNGVAAGNGIYGQEDRKVDFKVGDAHIYKVDAQAHTMKVFSNGKLLRTIPITTGKPGFTTRSGIKVISEKYDSKRMNSETVGISAGSSEAYDISNVQWAMRVTDSGEFIHAAPWSVGSQGYANVSHGCTGLSTDNAGWLYSMTNRGDVVEYTGTDRGMEPGNGWTDWNVSWKEYQKGSALG